MAVPVESEFITQFFSAPVTFRSDMIDLYLISVSEGEFTPPAFPLLFPQQLCELTFRHWVVCESLAPIEEISIVWACCTFYFYVPFDSSVSVVVEFELLIPEHPLAFSNGFPVFLCSPVHVFLRVPKFYP